MQNNHENEKILDKNDNNDNIGTEEAEEKARSASRIFFLVLGLHILVVAAAIAFHMLRSPSGQKSATGVTEPERLASKIRTTPVELKEPQSPLEKQHSSPEQTTQNQDPATLANNTNTVSDLTNGTNLSSETIPPVSSIHSELPKPTTTHSQNPPLIQEKIYIVRPGDTLARIAQRFGTTVKQIMEDNNLRNEKIVVGERLVIRFPGVSSKQPNDIPIQTGGTQKLPLIQPQQQTLSAKKFSQQGSTIPTTQSQETSAKFSSQTHIPSTPYTLPSEEILYTVKKGDTLHSISKKYGLTIDNIKTWNNLDSDILREGQILRITPLQNIVQSGSSLQVPQPGTPRPPSNLSPFPTSTQENKEKPFSEDQQLAQDPHATAQTIHTVSPGDTLYSLARAYNTTVENIKKDNELTSDFLPIGRKIIIKHRPAERPFPSTNSASLLHTVKPGETLYSISRAYGVTIKDLIAVNQLQSANIYVGQKLIVPLTTKSNGPEENNPSSLTTSDVGSSSDLSTSVNSSPNQHAFVHIVRRGETLYRISAQYGVSVESLCKINNISDKDALKVGQQLKIPRSQHPNKE